MRNFLKEDKEKKWAHLFKSCNKSIKIAICCCQKIKEKMDFLINSKGREIPFPKRMWDKHKKQSNG
jgi:hypothetical protein